MKGSDHLLDNACLLYAPILSLKPKSLHGLFAFADHYLRGKYFIKYPIFIPF